MCIIIGTALINPICHKLLEANEFSRAYAAQRTYCSNRLIIILVPIYIIITYRFKLLYIK